MATGAETFFALLKDVKTAYLIGERNWLPPLLGGWATPIEISRKPQGTDD